MNYEFYYRKIRLGHIFHINSAHSNNTVSLRLHSENVQPITPKTHGRKKKHTQNWWNWNWIGQWNFSITSDGPRIIRGVCVHQSHILRTVASVFFFSFFYIRYFFFTLYFCCCCWLYSFRVFVGSFFSTFHASLWKSCVGATNNYNHMYKWNKNKFKRTYTHGVAHL